MKVRLLGLCALLFLAACQSPSEKMTAEVMAMHDDAMAKMVELNQHVDQIKSWYDGLPDTDEAALLGDSLLNAILMLRKADDSMGSWMQVLADNRDSIDNLTDATAFWTAEKERITNVKNEIDKANMVASQLLKAAPAKVILPDSTAVKAK